MNEKIDWKRKLTSRKMWAAICALAVNLIIAFGGTEQVATQVTAIIMGTATVIAYIIGEGLVDAAGAKDNYTVTSGYVQYEPPEEEPEEPEGN